MRPCRRRAWMLDINSALDKALDVTHAPLVDFAVRVEPIDSERHFMSTARRTLGARLRTETAVLRAADVTACLGVDQELDAILDRVGFELGARGQ